MNENINNKKAGYAQLRVDQYEHHSISKFPEMHAPFSSPYTWLKARFYMELSAMLVFLLLKTNVHPNTITMIYGLAGLFGGALIASGMESLVVAGVVVFFVRGVFDWSDGHLATRTGRTSRTGHILDVYGAILGSIGLGVGVGLFVADRTGYLWIYYLVPLYPIFRALLLSNYGQSILLRKMAVTDYSEFDANKALKKRAESQNIQDSSLFQRGYRLVYTFMDDRARTVDFIGLMILIDLFNGTDYTFYIFLLLMVKWFVAYAGSFYVVGRGGWVEREHDAVIASVLKCDHSVTDSAVQ